MGRTVAVTGGTGFIGSHIVERLCADGWRVRVLTRRLPVRPEFADRTVEAVIGALDDPDSIQELVRGAGAVVHCAGLVKAIDARGFRRVNEAGTAALAAAAAQGHPPPYFVLISSLAARVPALSHYAASKRAGEQALAAHAGTMPWAALRPPVVYGPGDLECLALFQCAARGFAPLLGGDANRVSLIHVGDLAAAVATLLAEPAGESDIFELDDGAGGYSWRDLFELAGAALGRRPRALPVPRAALAAVAMAATLVARATGRPAMLSPGKVREILHSDWLCRDRALIERTSWRPVLPAREGFAATVAWYRRNGWLHDL